MKVLIIGGGELKATEHLKELASQAKLVIAADSGLQHAKSLEVIPDVLVGDFDSISKEALEHYPTIAREKYSSEKNDLDLELAIDLAIAKGAKKLILLGALGSRLDQSLAAIFIAARLKSEGLSVSLHSEKQDVYPLAAKEEIKLDVPLATTFSLLSLERTSKVSIFNAKYPLDNHLLDFGFGLGVSNEVTSLPLIVQVNHGLVLCVLERESTLS